MSDDLLSRRIKRLENAIDAARADLGKQACCGLLRAKDVDRALQNLRVLAEGISDLIPSQIEG